MEFGKFKDATSLLNSYNSLEREFTKKCQELKQLKEQLNNTETKVIEPSTDNACAQVIDAPLGGNAEFLEGKEVNLEPAFKGIEESAINYINNLETGATESDVCAEAEIKQSCGEVEAINEVDDLSNEVVEVTLKTSDGEQQKSEAELVKEKFSSFLWREQVNKFFSENKDAVAYKKSIGKILTTNPDLALLKNCLSLAYSIAKSEPASVGFQDKALPLESGSTKERSVDEFFESLKKRKSSAPRFADSVSCEVLKPNVKIKTFKDASDYVLKHFC